MSNARRTTLGHTPLALLLFAGVAAAQVPSLPPGVQWTQSVEFALQSARESGAPILAFVSSDHCGYCRKMERDTWANPRVAAEVNRAFVPLELTPELHPQEVRQLGVQAFPTTLVIHHSGRVLLGAAGYLPPTKATELLRSALAPSPETPGNSQFSQTHP